MSEATEEQVGGYRVVRRLAAGGTSDVLLAVAEGPDASQNLVVLKVLPSKYQRDADAKATFAREAAVYARLSHPSVVRLYDFLANGDQLVLVLHYVDGPPLNRLRTMLRGVGEDLDDESALYIAGHIFEALAAAHSAVTETGEVAPIIHCDVNPANVLVSWDGEVKLADFGMAKVTGLVEQRNAGLTGGKYGYMAPEQVRGEPLTPRVDVYGAAIILWELLTKRRAFIRGALSEATALRDLAEPRIVSIDLLRPDLDKNLREAVKRALHSRASRRTITAEEMAATLRDALPLGAGRANLRQALALVRHEPMASATSMPPAMPDLTDEVETARYLAPGLIPARPGASASRAPVPRPAILAGQRTRRVEKAMPAVTLSPEEVALVMEQGPSASASASPAPAVVGPSSVQGLASSLESSSQDPGGRSADVEAFDSLFENRALALPPGHPSGFVPPRAPGAAASRPLSEAIDDILGYVPTNIPPDMAFPQTAPRGVQPAGGTPTHSIQATPTLDLGVVRPRASTPPVPPRPEPLPGAAKANVAPRAGNGVPASPFAKLNDVLLTPGATAPIGATAPMPTLPQPPLAGPTAPMRGFPAPQAALGAFPENGPEAAGPSLEPPHSSSSPPTRPRSSVAMVTILLLLASIAGGIAAGGFVRWQKGRTTVRGAPLAPRIATASTAASPAAGTASAGAAGTAPAGSASAEASGGPSAGASATAFASASAALSESTAVLAPSAASEDVPTGMGRVRTAGSVPGRRIFVDERVVGQTPDAVVVRCGTRKIKLGSAGARQTVDVPCGGEITLGDR